uniref:PC-esterase domain containing 1A n=1 Tax=Callithrix jacchus TaxID=9483 RepID=A0A8I3XAA8_CALJA
GCSGRADIWTCPGPGDHQLLPLGSLQIWSLLNGELPGEPAAGVCAHGPSVARLLPAGVEHGDAPGGAYHWGFSPARVQHRHRDGVHWDQHAHRHLSHLLLTHVADAWGVELPKRDYLPGCGPGVKFVRGPLPPPIPGPNPHGQHWGPVVHRGMPRCVPNSPYHVPRMGGPCRQRLRHSERLIHTYKLDRWPTAHSGTWPG